MEKSKNFYFTFGFNQKYENGYHIIKAKNRQKARDIMLDKFGLEWSMQYDEKQWILENGKTQAEEYNLKGIK